MNDDFLTEKGARSLADRIETHWRQRGYMGIRCWVEPVVNRDGHQMGLYGVRSNMRGGVPPARRALAA